MKRTIAKPNDETAIQAPKAAVAQITMTIVMTGATIVAATIAPVMMGEDMMTPIDRFSGI
jgi:preprotein translocase subunit SecF